MSPIERRASAAQATLDRFKDRPFAWGTNDCGRMTAFHLRKMRRPVPVAKAGTYRTAASARAALKRLGYSSLVDLLDARFERIPPASALVGDLLSLEADNPLGAITVAMGNGRVLGWHEDAPGAVVMQPTRYDLAWRVI